jgi:hypothetical protein
MDLVEMECGVMDLTELVRDTVHWQVLFAIK